MQDNMKYALECVKAANTQGLAAVGRENADQITGYLAAEISRLRASVRELTADVEEGISLASRDDDSWDDFDSERLEKLTARHAKPNVREKLKPAEVLKALLSIDILEEVEEAAE